MIYTFECTCGHEKDVTASIKVGPPAHVTCKCGARMERQWRMPQVICAGDPDDIPKQFQTCDFGPGPIGDRHMFGIGEAAAKRKERLYTKAIAKRRTVLRENRDRKSSWRHTHSVPAELYHGKIRETGDRNYWEDRRNLERHTSCKVD